MAVILNIETSGTTCSVALTAEGMILRHYENFEGRNHATLLSDYIKLCFDHLQDHEIKLDAVAVSLGPGSYTGLRIGLSEAKGLAYSLDIPLIGLSTLEIMAVGAMFQEDADPEALLAPMIDARRMEVYTAVYDFALNPIVKPTPLILEPDSYERFLAEGRVVFFGDGSDKARDLFGTNPNARFISDVVPLATDMTALADRAFSCRDFLDIAYSVPEYLKDFQAIKPKKLF
ncbi:MAG: tRNA (adenosine(37)-N6)-threonylcarbamoyltransferase complex dimerization subunit type 1 TsaB [Muribaculaceae bacterium]|nr:tRNA (adenosine(37)-N6)-threonylcarbamoyltransferase complex dimerization subunit type 1 TsaB [Muribaculaceae bacterium]